MQTKSFSTVDPSFCSLETMRDFEQKVDSDLHGSDHFAICLTSSAFIPQHQVPRWIKKRANWELFSSLTEGKRRIPEAEPREYYDSIVDLIHKGASESIPKSDGFYQMCPVPWWNPNCEALKKERLKVQRQMMRSPSVTNRVCYKRLQGRLQRAQKDSQKTSWMKFVTSVN